MSINLICAMDKNRGIGYQDKLLCHLPRDLKHFKYLTKNEVCVMGRKTFESIIDQLGKPLPNRVSLVMTRDATYDTSHEDSYVFNSVDDILYDYEEHCNGDMWIIGGQQIYELFLPYADKLYLTIIDHKFDNVDSYFPTISDEWKCISMVENQKDENNPYDFHFLVYEKNKF